MCFCFYTASGTRYMTRNSTTMMPVTTDIVHFGFSGTAGAAASAAGASASETIVPSPSTGALSAAAGAAVAEAAAAFLVLTYQMIMSIA